MKITDHTLLPHAPGVYMHIAADGEVLYVGKAKDLRKRVAAYFRADDQTPKHILLAQKRAYLDYVVTDSELEALIVENKLIKLHKPRYNILLKEAEKYVYIKITDEQFPRLVVTRAVQPTDSVIGPYKTASVRTIVRVVNDLFGLRRCGDRLPAKACLYQELGLCSAPCQKMISSQAYRARVEKAVASLKDGCIQLRDQFEQQMRQASKELRFEDALTLKQKLQACVALQDNLASGSVSSYDADVVLFEQVAHQVHIVVCHMRGHMVIAKETYTFAVDPDAYEDFIKQYYSAVMPPERIIVSVLEDELLTQYLEHIWKRGVRLGIAHHPHELQWQELAGAYLRDYVQHADMHRELQTFLEMNTYPRVIDFFDISCFRDTVLVGSCVRYEAGKPQKDLWRRGSMRQVLTQDDPACMAEFVERRYAKLSLPDLIIADGGITQLLAVQRALGSRAAECTIVGLAKREETIVCLDGTTKRLPVTTALGRYVQAMRDKAHEFGITYSRFCMKKRMRSSALDTLAGVGPITKKLLFKRYGSLEAVQKATREELAKIIGQKRADLVKDGLAVMSEQKQVKN